MIIEIWKQIEDFPMYEISNTGTVKSNCKSRIKYLMPQNSHGYEVIFLYDLNGKKHLKHIHRLVIEAFIGPAPTNAHTVNHKDGIKYHNQVDNLEWLTLSENRKHAFKIGIDSHVGENNPSAKLTGQKVEEIRKLHGTLSLRTLAQLYQVSYGSICDVVYKRSWKHI